jgi:hypothetical protein
MRRTTARATTTPRDQPKWQSLSLPAFGLLMVGPQAVMMSMLCICKPPNNQQENLPPASKLQWMKVAMLQKVKTERKKVKTLY